MPTENPGGQTPRLPSNYGPEPAVPNSAQDGLDEGARGNELDGAVSSLKAGAKAGIFAAEEFSVREAIGGVRGVIESTVPTTAFVIAYALGASLLRSAIVAGSLALIALLARLIRREAPTQALAGLLAIGIGVAWARASGRAQDYYLWGILVQALYGGGLLLSIALRYPLVGVVVELLRGGGMSWRRGAESARIRRRYYAATWMWVGLFAVRLLLQLPAYFAGQVAWLGTVKILTGLPLWLLTVWFTWLLVRQPKPSEDHQEPR